MALVGRATAPGTQRYAERWQATEPNRAAVAGHPDLLGGLAISPLGLGLAAGEPTVEVDAAYRAAIDSAVRSGCNHFDTAPSYRGQRSEATLGRALAAMFAAGVAQRDEIIVASKAGFIPYPANAPGDQRQAIYDGFIAPGIAEPDDLAGGIHCLAPDFVSHQITWSLRTMGLRHIDIYYLQNPETQLSFVDRTTFRRRLQLAFARLEEEVAGGRIGCYGVATWEGLRLPPLSDHYMSLEVVMRLVTEVAGPRHHLRVVQMPLSLATLEAMTLRNQPIGKNLLAALPAAADLGLAVVASAALGQGQIPPRLEQALGEAYGGLDTFSQRALQFARSLPGVASALFGSVDAKHVRENLAVLDAPPDPKAALRLVRMKGR